MNFSWFISSFIVLLLAWQALAYSGFVSSALFPSPVHVGRALLGMISTGIIFIDVRDSLGRVTAGLCAGSIVGVLVGLLTGRIIFFDAVLSPVIQFLRPFPPVALIPLIIVWFGIDDVAKIISIAFAVFFPVWINTYLGARQIPKPFLWSAQLLTHSSLRIWSSVILPASLPFILAGIRTGVAVAFVMVFVSELAGASSGLGYRISVTHLSYRLDEMMAALIVLGFLGATVDQLFAWGARRAFPWMALPSL